MVFEIFVYEVNGATEVLSQRNTVPVLPLNVKLPTLDPLQIAPFPLIDPATEG